MCNAIVLDGNPQRWYGTGRHWRRQAMIIGSGVTPRAPPLETGSTAVVVEPRGSTRLRLLGYGVRRWTALKNPEY